jgi:secondary thiamine-phosphate synthase enzyme
METLTTAPACRHSRFQISTRQPGEFVDLTERLQRLIAEAAIGVGILNVQTLHTTTAIVVNEHEPLLLADFAAMLEAAAPQDRCYGHDDWSRRTVNVVEGERANGHSHCRALMLPTSVCLNISGGRLVLGRWQRVFFVELDGPREREVSALTFGEAWR